MKIQKSISLEEIEDQAKKDLQLRIDKTSENSLDTPRLHNKYLKHYRIVRNELDALNLKLDALSLKKWLYYSGKAHPRDYDKNPLDHKIMKSDVKLFLAGDSNIIKLKFEINLTETKLQVVRKLIEEINRRSFHIKNAIETMKFKSGVN